MLAAVTRALPSLAWLLHHTSHDRDYARIRRPEWRRKETLAWAWGLSDSRCNWHLGYPGRVRASPYAALKTEEQPV